MLTLLTTSTTRPGAAWVIPRQAYSVSPEGSVKICHAEESIQGFLRKYLCQILPEYPFGGLPQNDRSDVSPWGRHSVFSRKCLL